MKRMKIISIAIAAVAALMLALPATALAESLSGGSNWAVTYTSGGTMTDNYSTTEFVDAVSGLQPGDDITFTIACNHENAGDAAWYLSNDVVKSLETGSASGSAYGYLLTYSGPNSNTSRTIYDSSTVGGDDSNGLLEATDAMEDYIYLDTLSKGQSGKVTLKVTLDGETEGNAYFDTLAQVKMRFAVDPTTTEPDEPTPDNPTTPSRDIVRTGDDTNLFPFYVAMAASGALLLVLAGWSVRARRREQKK